MVTDTDLIFSYTVVLLFNSFKTISFGYQTVTAQKYRSVAKISFDEKFKLLVTLTRAQRYCRIYSSQIKCYTQ